MNLKKNAKKDQGQGTMGYWVHAFNICIVPVQGSELPWVLHVKLLPGLLIDWWQSGQPIRSLRLVSGFYFKFDGMNLY